MAESEPRRRSTREPCPRVLFQDEMIEPQRKKRERQPASAAGDDATKATQTNAKAKTPKRPKAATETKTEDKLAASSPEKRSHKKKETPTKKEPTAAAIATSATAETYEGSHTPVIQVIHPVAVKPLPTVSTHQHQQQSTSTPAAAATTTEDEEERAKEVTVEEQTAKKEVSGYEEHRRQMVLRNREFLQKTRTDTPEGMFTPPQTPSRRGSHKGVSWKAQRMKKFREDEEAGRITKYTLRQRRESEPIDLSRAAPRGRGSWAPTRSWVAPIPPTAATAATATEGNSAVMASAKEKLVGDFVDLTDPAAMTPEILQPIVAMNARVLRHPARAGRGGTCFQPFLFVQVNTNKECWTKNSCRVAGGSTSVAGISFGSSHFRDQLKDLLLTFPSMAPAHSYAVPPIPTGDAAPTGEQLLAGMPYLSFLGSSPYEVAEALWRLFASMPRTFKQLDPKMPTPLEVLWQLSCDVHPWFSRAGIVVPLPWPRFFSAPVASSEAHSRPHAVATAMALVFFSHAVCRAFCMDTPILMETGQFKVRSRKGASHKKDGSAPPPAAAQAGSITEITTSPSLEDGAGGDDDDDEDDDDMTLDFEEEGEFEDNDDDA